MQHVFGFALWQAQIGKKHIDAKPLRGFGGASILEIVESHGGNAFRAIYTVRFKEAVYVLHAFQKKSKTGRKTPSRDIGVLRQRLKIAEQHYEQWQRQKKVQGDLESPP